MSHSESMLETAPPVPMIESAAAASVGVVERGLRRGLCALGESYMRGEWESEQLDRVLFDVLSAGSHYTAADLLRLAGYACFDRLMNLQKVSRAFEIARQHYDLGNDLFSVMLDDSMTYTCGYWRDARNLAEAQEAKLKLACDKLKLEPGMRVLDIGCGWGNFADYAARVRGVEVVGVTVSEEQAGFARQRCAGLPVTILLQDYRAVRGEFDRVVSIEMIEAVGRKNLPVFYRTVADRLKPGGLFLLQAISAETVSRYSHAQFDSYLMWILKYIFPNGYLPKITELTEPCRDDFIVEDLHNFGTDYDRTLMAWAENFERGWSALLPKYGPEFRRRWRYYLFGCAALFRARITQLYQIVYSRSGDHGGYSPVR